MYQNILIPIDVAVESSWRKPLPAAIDHSRHFPAAVLHLVAVVPELPPQLAFLPEEYTARMVSLATEKLAAIVQNKVPQDIPARQYIRQGCVFREILKAAVEVNADLIIMGPHQPEFEDYLLGPNASRVVRHADCSVLIVR